MPTMIFLSSYPFHAPYFHETKSHLLILRRVGVAFSGDIVSVCRLVSADRDCSGEDVTLSVQSRSPMRSQDNPGPRARHPFSRRNSGDPAQIHISSRIFKGYRLRLRWLSEWNRYLFSESCREVHDIFSFSAMKGVKRREGMQKHTAHVRNQRDKCHCHISFFTLYFQKPLSYA